MSQSSPNPGAEFTAIVKREAAGRLSTRNLKPLKGLLPFIFRYKGVFAAAMVFLVIAAGASLALPLAGGRLVDQNLSSETLTLLSESWGTLFILMMILAVAASLRYYFITWLGERVVADLREAVFTHITSLSPAFFEVTRTGEVLSRLTTDTTLIQTVVGSTVSIALRSLVMGVGALTMLLLTSAKLTGVVLLTVPILIVTAILLGRWLRTLSRSSQDRLAHTSAFASESLHAIQTVQAFTHEKLDRNLYKRAVEGAFWVSIRRVIARAIMTGTVSALAFSSIILVLMFGVAQISSGAMSEGELAQFFFYAVMLAINIAALSEVWSEVQRAAGAAERLMELLAIEPVIKAPENPVAMPTPPEGRVRFEHVTFQYPTRPDISALDDFNLMVEPGETVALVGPSGAGKTTVFQLLLRFYDPQGGAVSIDGVNVAGATPQDVRSRISVVQQDTTIFSGTVMENLRYGRPDASDEEITQAAIAARADVFINALPLGYGTELGERGMMLSGGQRQRIAIARAILRGAPILLLDEATSSLDAQSEQLVQQALDGIMVGRTTLVIAHRLATVVKADRIVVVDHGRVVDMGTHEELIAKGGLYAQLAELQFGAHETPPLPGPLPQGGEGATKTSLSPKKARDAQAYVSVKRT